MMSQFKMSWWIRPKLWKMMRTSCVHSVTRTLHLRSGKTDRELSFYVLVELILDSATWWTTLSTWCLTQRRRIRSRERLLRTTSMTCAIRDLATTASIWRQERGKTSSCGSWSHQRDLVLSLQYKTFTPWMSSSLLETVWSILAPCFPSIPLSTRSLTSN